MRHLLKIKMSQSHLYCTSVDKDTLEAEELLRQLAKELPEHSEILIRGANEIKDLLKRLDSIWNDHRWCE
jgi:hypothetical protein